MSKPLLQLEAAKALIERGWTQGAYARNASGAPVDPLDPTACAWCMSGAFLAVDGDPSPLLKVVSSIPSYNDQPYRTKEAVLQVFDLAIKYQRGDPVDTQRFTRDDINSVIAFHRPT